MSSYPKQAALALIRRGDLVLGVWNAKYQCYGLPGGKVEPNESVYDALCRELEEETSLKVVHATCLYSAFGNVERDRHVFVFEVTEASGVARQVEPNHPLKWMTLEELAKGANFAPYYDDMLETLRSRHNRTMAVAKSVITKRVG